MATAVDILIDRMLEEVDRTGLMPWQRPYELYDPFNFISMTPYNGFNRLILPFGEYLTQNQIEQYNKQHKEDFRYQKGIQWYPISFFKVDKKEITLEQMEKALGQSISPGVAYQGTDGYWKYTYIDGKAVKSRSVLRYYLVTDRKYLKNSKGEEFPSRLKEKEVVITKHDAFDVIKGYLEREGISHDFHSADVPYYDSHTDFISMNMFCKDEESFFSTAFHELAHSTGAEGRLNRDIKSVKGGTEEYYKEECIAELTAFLLCAETGISSFDTQGVKEFENQAAYLRFYKKKIKQWGKEFIYIVSQADKAFKYILGEL